MMFLVTGPFTRPHPAIWRIVFGEYLLKASECKTALKFPFLMSCSLLPRSECPLLPVPGFHHLPELAASETAYVLVGPKPALCQERGRRNGEWFRLTEKVIYLIDLHPPPSQLCPLSGGLSAFIMRHACAAFCRSTQSTVTSSHGSES